MKLPSVAGVLGFVATAGFMALLLGLPGGGSSGLSELRVPESTTANVSVQPNRTEPLWTGSQPRRLLQDKVLYLPNVVLRWSPEYLGFLLVAVALFSVVCFMQAPQAATGQNNMRLPPRWDPNMETTLPFRTWVQDLMLWTICTDLEPHQQCAAIISQLGGAARELARLLTPQEVYHGGVVNGQMLDPVSLLLHGLSTRFAPLDEETRLRAAQDLLAFTRRAGESVDAVVSRFEITRQRARDEGGGAVSVETASLLLLRACGVSSEQFQALTQPFGLRLPSTEPEFSQMCHHLRRMGHIVERHPNNIASGLRQSAQAFMAEADTGSSVSGEQWAPEAPGLGGTAWAPQDHTDWAFAAVSHGDGASDTDSATSSDNDEPMDVSDLQGMSNTTADEYLFGEYQHAKRRWRRFTGKPVRSLRKVIRRKGKGKGKSRSYLNLSDVLQQSAYFKGKGKGGKSSGKGFGRRLNPRGRDGEPLKCSTCGSAYHLRARCPRRNDASGPATSSAGPAAAPTSGMHFAAFESDGSWTQVSSQVPSQAPTPRSLGQASRSMPGPSDSNSEAAQASGLRPPQEVEVHNMSPDPWLSQPDPWTEWYHSRDAPSVPVAPEVYHNPFTQVQSAIPSLRGPPVRTFQPVDALSWQAPGIGHVGSRQSFADTIGLNSGGAAGNAPVSAPSINTVPATAIGSNSLAPLAPGWFTEVQRQLSTVHEESSARRAHRTEPSQPSATRASPMFAALSNIGNTQPTVLQRTEEPASVLSVFGQVHALRASSSSSGGRHNREPRSVASSQENNAAPASVSARSSPQPFQGHVATCTICLAEYMPGDHLLRLECGHVFHSSCVGELAAQLGAAFSEEGAMAVECPNCRTLASAVRDWRVPQVPPASDAVDNAQVDESPAAASPEPVSSGHDEFMTPEEAVFPWWPVKDHNEPATSSTATPSTTAYHSSVRLASGKVGLLVDPGSYGNLVGEMWLTDAASRMQKEPQLMHRASPLQVGGVGKGAQQCVVDCRLPIALSRHDGSPATGTYTAPVVSQSACPALLGLKTLQDRRVKKGAILDCDRRLLHFPSEGEITLKLPPGSETFQLEAAESGHLLLPCDSFQHVPSSALPGEHHLFTEDPESAGEPDNDAQSREIAEHLLTSPLSEASHEEEVCAAALQEYTFERGSECLVSLMQRWEKHQGPNKAERFLEHSGISKCLGMYTHGGVVGISALARERPNLCQLVCKLLRDCGCQQFTSVMMCLNIPAPVHRDSYNCGENVIVPLRMPKYGGNLWLELRTGDTISGAVQVKQVKGKPCAGQIVPLQVGKPHSFDPKHLHATEQWKQGERFTLAAYTTGSYWKADPAVKAELQSRGFAIPLTTPDDSAPPEDDQGTRADVLEYKVEEAPASQPPHSQSSAGLHVGPKAAASNCSRTKRVSFTSSAQTHPLSFIRRVLLISVFHSTLLVAFQDNGWEPMRIRPVELLRASFDDVVGRMKRSEFEAVWVDLTDARQFAGQEHTAQVCSRLNVLITWAQRQSIPVFMSASRSAAWQHAAVQEMIHRHQFFTSHHCWCHVGAKMSSSVQASAAKHKVLSTVRLQDHRCKCAPGTDHTYDLDMHKGEPGTAALRAEAERKVVSTIVATLQPAAGTAATAGSTKSADPVCISVSNESTTKGMPRAATRCTVEPCIDRTELSQALPVTAVRRGSFQARGLQQSISGPDSSPNEFNSFPTEQKVQQRMRAQQQKENGQESVTPKRRKKIVEQHFDDCGEDLSSLQLPTKDFLVIHSSSDEDDASADEVVQAASPQLNAFALWALASSMSDGLPLLRKGTLLAVDVDEMIRILCEQSFHSNSVELLEICGGESQLVHLCVRRQLKSGKCFELTTGVDLTQPEAQQKVFGYLDVAKPLIVIMSPTQVSYVAWGASAPGPPPGRSTSQDVVAFCGQVALIQCTKGNHFLYEQPFPSQLLEVQPWPKVTAREDCYQVVLHQCCLGLRVNNQLCKKPTQLISSTASVLQEFIGLQCNGQHVHALIGPSNAYLARDWPFDMCDRVTRGIEQLIRSRHRHRRSCTRLSAFPTASVGTSDPG